eukprot:TRINITY_DN120780_c0_g1_i1.p1 TRINITY_DN120780_c0_g1~~TRINITY_DN120780_c0_g1_i1.p1  ORF type:complete len:585 (-),score=119.76 TRINITY_DN120780_c0_g1_i1:23-1777(-)
MRWIAILLIAGQVELLAAVGGVDAREPKDKHHILLRREDDAAWLSSSGQEGGRDLGSQPSLSVPWQASPYAEAQAKVDVGVGSLPDPSAEAAAGQDQVTAGQEDDQLLQEAADVQSEQASDATNSSADAAQTADKALSTTAASATKADYKETADAYSHLRACRDFDTTCFDKASEGACEAELQRTDMQFNCPVSCGLCGVPGSGWAPYFGGGGRHDTLVPVVVRDLSDVEATLPAWAHQRLSMAGPYRLPQQPSCISLLGASSGSSDHGREKHKCAACEEACTYRTKQAPLHTSFNFHPKLESQNAMDMIMFVELSSISQLAPFSMNGIQYKMNFNIMRAPDSNAFRGVVGPVVRGGAADGESLAGQHYLEVKDTQLPSPDGMLVRGRWLALPGARKSGDLGSCVRACVGCDNYPQLRSSGLTTGVACKLDVGVDDGHGFVYRIRQSKAAAQVQFEGVQYDGAEWEVTVRDTVTEAYYVLGRVLLEGASEDVGIATFTATHEHLGCAPCDAYFQAVRVNGPYVLQPSRQHIMRSCEITAGAESGALCKLHRAVSLGGLTVLYESGPSVWPKAPMTGRAIYKCSI